MRISLCLALAIAARVHAQAPRPIQRVAWLTGCWQNSARGRVIDEQWMAPRAGTMIGMGRTTRGDTTLVEFEHTQILERNGRLIYHAEPSGQSPADFTQTVLSDTNVTFENLAHDFPQRVMYRRVTPDSVLARVEGMLNGQLRGTDFPYTRVSCERL